MRLLFVLVGIAWAWSAAAETIERSLVSGAPVIYKSPQELKEFPLPAVSFQRPALVSANERLRIQREILAPLTVNSADPVAAFVVEFDKESSSQFLLDIIWANGRVYSTVGPPRGSAIPTSDWIARVQDDIDHPDGDWP